MKPSFFTVIIIFFLFQSTFSTAREKSGKLDLSAGYSIPEICHFGLRYNYQPTRRIDFRLGTNLLPDDYYSATLNHAWYFGKLNEKSGQKHWTVNSAVTASYRSNHHREGYLSYFSLFFAREFMLSKKWFIQPEAGASHLISDNTKIMDGLYEGYTIRVTPRFGVSMILKL